MAFSLVIFHAKYNNEYGVCTLYVGKVLRNALQ